MEVVTVVGSVSQTDREKLSTRVPISPNTRGLTGKEESVYIKMNRGSCSSGNVSHSRHVFLHFVLMRIMSLKMIKFARWQDPPGKLDNIMILELFPVYFITI